jgi:uncharacterized protein (DUF58 family)
MSLPSSDQRRDTPQPFDATHVDPATLMRIRNLQLRAKSVVEGFYNGLHRSPFHGFSAEFSEYRPYTPGDDPRYLDWKLFARSDRFYIKRFEDETNRRCYLLVDLSRSMGYGSIGYTKIEYARTMAATLAYYLSLQRDSVGLLTFADDVYEFLAARHRPGHFHQFLVCLERSLQGTSTNLAAPLERIAKTIRKRGLVIWISDLLAPIESVQQNLGYLRSRGHEVVVLRVLDPAEIDFQLDGATMLQDLESGREMFIDPEVAAADYRARFAEHEQAIRDLCDPLGVDFYRTPTDQPLEQVLFHILNTQLRRGRNASRVRANPRGIS